MAVASRMRRAVVEVPITAGRNSRSRSASAAAATPIVLLMVDEEAAQQYLGLARDAALLLAEQEGRVLVDRTPHFHRRRANHVNNRVNVLLDQAGVVVLADVG